MKAVTYIPSEDLEKLRNLCALRNISSDVADDLPEHGCVVTENGHIVAAAFIRPCGRNIAIFDGLISDPSQSAESRNEAQDLAISKMLEVAKELKLKGIIAWASEENTIMRAERHGFQQLPHSVMVLDLSK